MEYTKEEIEKIKEHNKQQKGLFNPWPAIAFFIGVAICGLWFFKHTRG